LNYEETSQEVILWLKVHFVAAHYTDVDLILAVKGKRTIFSSTAKQLCLYGKKCERVKPQLKISMSTSMTEKNVHHFTRALGTEEDLERENPQIL